MTALSRRLAAALRTISLDPGSCTARVGQREVSAADPVSFRHQLTAVIYDELHAGRAALSIPSGRNLRDPVLEERLRAALPHRRTIRSAEAIAVSADAVLVGLDGVRVWVPIERVGAGDGKVQPGDRAEVLVPAGRPALSPGFFLADGARPQPAGEPVLRVYVHLQTVAAALQVWTAVLGLLADLGVGYRAKVASWPQMLPRRDALVLYLAERDVDVARQVSAVTAGVRGVGRRVSVFAQPVGPGVAIAREPADTRAARRDLSFGEHRSAALADGLLRPAGPGAAAERSAAAVRGAMTARVREALAEAGIDPANPARNR
jgi:hypothetical protein